MTKSITITKGTVQAIKELFANLWYSNVFYLIGTRDYATGDLMVITGRSIRVWQRARCYFKTMANNPMAVYTFTDAQFNAISEGLTRTASKSEKEAMEKLNAPMEESLRAILEHHGERVGQECFKIGFDEAVKIIEDALSL